MKACIKVKNLNFSYHEQLVLDIKELIFPQGQIIGILGPNGSGKSTLLKCITKILPHKGEISITNGLLAYIPQREQVDWTFPITVYDLVSQGRYPKRGFFKRFSPEDRKIIQNSINHLQLTEYKKRQISELSGGQQQRAFIARAIAQEADIYIMDEPFVGVDAVTETAIISLLQELKSQGKTVIIVHHDLSTVKDYFDHIIMINKKIIAEGNVQKTFTKDNLEKLYGGSITYLK